MEKSKSFSDYLAHPFVVVFGAIVLVALGYQFGQFIWDKLH
jgi:hypothetical protein